MKYIKLFESFVNEELSPELKKRAYDAMVKIANDPNAIDNLKRGDQAYDLQKSLTPAVEALRKDLEVCAQKVFPNAQGLEVILVDSGLSNGSGFSGFEIEHGSVFLSISVGGTPILNLVIGKDKYEKGENIGTATSELYLDRTFVNTLKKLIVQIQKDEIPGKEVVPSEPESVTPEGSLDYIPQDQLKSMIQ